MLALNIKKKRFTLLYLEENEVYVQDLTGSCSFTDPSTNQRKLEKGKIHLCSRSIIFEANNANVPIYKFLFKDMKKEPKLGAEFYKEESAGSSYLEREGSSEDEEIVFEMRKIYEIVTSGPPSPYKVQEVENSLIKITPAYENIQKLMEKITKLVASGKNSSFKTDPQEEINRLILEDSKLRFNMSHLESITERPLIKNQLLVKRVLPLVTIPGIWYLTNANIYFQSLHSVVAKPVKIIHLTDITKIFKRRYELRQIGMEIYTNKKSYYFTFENNAEREEIYNILIGTLGKEYDSERRLEQITEKWQREEISNYEYLMYLNEAADRTFSDLTQYPVFPWVIQEYEATSIDLNNKEIYRDLTKPIGALNPERLNLLLQRYKTMPEPKYLYGTHYSAPGYVIGYLVRKHPQYMLKLQSGKFDKPDRMFWSLKKDWHNVIKNNAIVKELIPEFYGEDTSFLVNYNKIDLGVRQNGKRVNDVKIPKWAKDPKDFLKINRAALESKYVSDNLQHWIDLIFGYKQRGQDAIASHNVFHYLTYEGAVDLDAISDPMERIAITIQINEFGQTPRQLFKSPHPPRYDLKAKILMAPRRVSTASRVKSEDPDQKPESASELRETNEIEEEKEESNPIFLEESYKKNDSPSSLGSRKVSKANEGGYSTLWDTEEFDRIQTQQVHKVHKGEISQVLELSENRVLSIGYDGFIKLTQIKDMIVSRSFKVCDMSLSSIVQLKENELYALGAWDNNVYIFNLNYGTRVFSESLHNDAISQIVYDPNRSVFCTGSWDCSVKAWGYKGGQIDTSSEDLLAEMNSQISKMTMSSDGNLLLFGDIEGNIHLVDMKTHQTITSYAIENEKITSLKFLNDNQIVASGETSVKLFDLSGSEYINLQIDSHLGNIADMEVDGANFIIATDRGNASVYDILQQKRLGSFCNKEGFEEGEVPPEYEFMSMGIINDGRTGVFGSKGGALTFAYYP